MQGSDVDVTFIVRTRKARRVRLPHIDANEIYGRARPGETPPARRLLLRLDAALRTDSDDHTVTVDDNPMREDLLDILNVIEDAGRFSEPLAELRKALQDPIVAGRY